MDYDHGSTANSIRGGVEVEHQADAAPAIQKSIAASQKSEADWMNEYDVIAWWLRNCYAPCVVADQFILQGRPFLTVAKAKAALRSEIVKKARLDPVVVSKYSSWELALVVQFDINGMSGPLPP